MRTLILISGLLAVVLLFGPGSAGAQSGSRNIISIENEDIQYTSGGVTMAEKSAMQDYCLVKKFNLKVIFQATARRYLKEMNVVVQNAEGRTVLSAVSQGPWFMAKLPAGEYKVRASLMGHERVKEVQLADDLVTLDFQWQPKVLD